jgi:kumamolisin
MDLRHKVFILAFESIGARRGVGDHSEEGEMNTVQIAGSSRGAMRGAKALGAARPDERFEVTVRVRRSTPIPASALDGTRRPRTRTYLTHTQHDSQHGAAAADTAKVEAFARANALAVVEVSAARRSVILSGTVAAFEKAFGVKLESFAHPRKGTFRGRSGPIHIPADLEGVVEGVFGLDNRPFARPHKARRRSSATAQFPGFQPPQVAQFYSFPEGLDGTGQTIGIIELGGGFRPADLTAYFNQIGVPVPHVTAVSVDHGRNAPSTPDSADGEVMLDIEVAASVAPKAKIVVYFTAGASDRDFLDAITTAVHDAANNPSVISISWGGPEEAATSSFQQQFDEVLQSAASLGVTVTVASGDSGAADEGPNEWDGVAHADFPASSPFALACGGTRITVAGNAITAESTWNQNAADTQEDSFGASGGGVSAVFPLPSYQQTAGVPVSVSTGNPGRGVPDVSGDADPASGYLVRVDGQEFPIGGTSAVAPLWAGLIALCNQSLARRVGFINPILYANPSAFNDITSGSNRVGPNEVGYDARPGWDACTGLGSPIGRKVLAALGA